MTQKIWEQGYTQNRELSWLQFNARVLAEAEDENVPLLERFKFLAIFTSNLDEFFMIRVGSLCDMAAVDKEHTDSKSGLTAKEQLHLIYKAVEPLYARRDAAFSDVDSKLSAIGLRRLTMDSLAPDEQKYIKRYFKDIIAPVLSPQIVDSHHPFPHLEGKVLHIAALLSHKKTERLGLLPVPASLPPVVFLPETPSRYILTEDILLAYADHVFEMYDVLEKTVLCVTRNADIQVDDETFGVEGGDFRKKMEKLLRQRRRMAVVRVEINRPISDHFKEHFRSRFEVSDAQIFLSRTAPLKLGYAFSLGEHLPEKKRAFLSDAPFTPQQPAMLSAGQSLLKAALQRDILLSYPYESMEPFLQMIREAANDPAVLAIRITIYRLASKAKLVEYLCAAAENGKDVTALIELRARFDEQNNIDWSERMEEAGCKIIYGFEDYKVHSKICLITRRERGAVRHITQVGTGNYNEKTAKQYTDVSLITADERIGQDAGAFFNNMALGNLSGRYSRLFVAPTSLKNNILALMDEQIAKGKDGYILLKFNSLTDIDVIAKLREASCAGVTVEMIVRGICCLLPGVPGHTENITVTSIVGRFLEHSRIYVFGRGDEEKMYISSADLMTRNTERRVEIACPIDDPAVRTRLHDILYAMQHDTVKARVLQPDGTYCKKPAVQDPICAQDLLMQQAIENARKQAAQPAPHPGFLKKIRKWFSGS
ncbi:polyphosphate kinase [Butyricicoccus faecihominis]|uniref:Polyphosphate kinase n=1 Tax=Butyricicoccus faecihominis TaxID=1712515 RepID=A0ABQ1E3E2_9FIRM|nr:polyphosphate kinase 1 [Butyricicoccus faecihominis]GFO89491.1 polyphosphate kinase [Butyricicoccus faecihominis]GGM78755.1 polyphosphate kinase [Butyricicoccus faecihominis]